jgi:hypothetical protein
MGLETGVVQPDDLTTTWPLDGDTRREGAAHLRILKTALANFSSDLEGDPADFPFVLKIYPVGSIYIAPAGGGNPNIAVGGTWQELGKINISALITAGLYTKTNGWALGLGGADGSSAEGYFTIWQLTAAPVAGALT